MSNSLSLFVWVVFTIFMSGFLGYRTGTLVDFSNLFTFHNAVSYSVGFLMSVLASGFMAWLLHTLFKSK
jgi:hypothetical protein